jgi:hypothetical protein
MKLLRSAALAILVFSPAGVRAAQIYGDYVETRSADVYTGACFANGEVGLTGDQAILAWRVAEGTWNGVALNGLSVVAVAKARATLGDPHSNPFPAVSVLILDERATPEQKTALQEFALAMGGELLANPSRVESAPIQFEVRRQGEHSAAGYVHAGDWAKIETRPIGDKDHLCGNEETYYQPLAATGHAMPGVALLDEYNGPALGVSWRSQGRRSAFVGSFSR